MVKVMCTNFLQVLHQFLTFQSIHCTTKFSTISDSVNLRLTLSGKLQWGGGGSEGKRLFTKLKRNM